MSKLDRHRERTMSRRSRPYKKSNWSAIKRLFISMLGKHVNDVYSAFCNSEFVPPELETWNEFWRMAWGFYVDENDIFRKREKKKFVKKEKPLDFIPITEYVQLIKEKGIWYCITIPRSFERQVWNPNTNKYDTITCEVKNPKRLPYYKLEFPYFWHLRTKTKEQLSSSELKKFGIRNA